VTSEDRTAPEALAPDPEFAGRHQRLRLLAGAQGEDQPGQHQHDDYGPDGARGQRRLVGASHDGVEQVEGGNDHPGGADEQHAGRAGPAHGDGQRLRIPHARVHRRGEEQPEEQHDKGKGASGPNRSHAGGVRQQV
jgi:hypothetical protein